MTVNTNGPVGYRDVWWCYVLNEPAILEYEKFEGVDQVRCCNCGWHGGPDGKSPSDFFRTQHTFICHIDKPTTPAGGAI